MLSRLPCIARGPFFKMGIATLRTQARTTIRTPVARRGTVVEKDWHFYGKLFLAGSAVVGGVSVVAVGLKHDALDAEVGALARSVIWPEYVSSRMKSTYMYFGLGLAATGGTMALTKNFAGLQNLMARHPIMAVIGFVGAQMAINSLQRSLPYTSENMVTKYLLAAGLYGMIGTVLGPLMHLGGPLVTRAAMYTGALVSGLTLAAMTAPSEQYLQMSGPLMMGFCAVFAASIATAFLPPTGNLGGGVYMIAVYGGVVLFSAMMLYQTQSIVQQCERIPYHMHYDPISASIGIYMTTINLFVRILNILMSNKRK